MTARVEMATHASERAGSAGCTDYPSVLEPVRFRPIAGAWVATAGAFSLAVLYFGLSSWLLLARHAAFNTGRFDLEIYTQVVWNTAFGTPFGTTLLKTNLSHLAEHLALGLVPMAVMYRVWPDPRLLILSQQLSLALIGLPLFLLARRLLKSAWQALVVLACFYATPALAGVALDDFHAVALAGLPLAIGLALVLAGRPRLGAAIALSAILVEEEAALFCIGLGAYLAATGRRALGALVGGLAIVWLAAAVFLVMPSFHDSRTLDSVGGNRTLGHFEDFGRDPFGALARVAGERGADAVLALGLPTAGLSLLAPTTLLVAAPSAVALLLQNRDDTFTRHWVTPLLVAIWFAAVAGLARIVSARLRWAALGALSVCSFLSFMLFSPLPGGGVFDPGSIERVERTELLERAVARIPPEGVVVASPNAVAHLANRAEAYVFPIDSHYAEELGWRRKRPDYYLLDLYDELTTRATISDRLNPLNADRPFHVWSAGRKVIVLSNQVGAPTVPLEARFGDRLLLKGYDVDSSEQGRRLVMHWERYAELRGRYDRDLTIVDVAGTQVYYEDDMALSREYGSNKWRPGQTILDEVHLPEVPGPLTVRVAWVAQEQRRPFRLADGSEAYQFVIPATR